MLYGECAIYWNKKRKAVYSVTQETYTQIEQYMHDCMLDSAHDVEHIYRVLYNAL